MKYGVLTLAVAGVLALPGSALATHAGSTCPDGPAYAQTTPDGSGSSDAADAAVGVCVDGVNATIPNWGFFDGGLVEVGVEGTDAYAVVDGDDANTDPSATDQSAGYIGVNTGFETGVKDGACDNVDSGTGTNSGGCLWVKPAGPGVSGSPIICGNTSGASWDASGRDGCALP